MFNRLQEVVCHLVTVYYWVPFYGDTEELALGSVEGHLPFRRPVGEGIEIILK